MNLTKRITRSSRLLFLGLAVIVSSFEIFAGYKIVLKDGKVLEAKAKPVSMEGHYRFTDANNQFQSIPIQLIDLPATQALNVREGPKATSTRVLTNEDLATGNKTPGKPLSTVGTAPKADAKNSTTDVGPKKGETYWRGRAKQIRDEIEKVDRQIKALNEKTQAGKSDGIKIGFETYNSVIYADFESQVKELEKQKEKLLKAMTALEEEARKEGALPGWLR